MYRGYYPYQPNSTNEDLYMANRNYFNYKIPPPPASYTLQQNRNNYIDTEPVLGSKQRGLGINLDRKPIIIQETYNVNKARKFRYPYVNYDQLPDYSQKNLPSESYLQSSNIYSNSNRLPGIRVSSRTSSLQKSFHSSESLNSDTSSNSSRRKKFIITEKILPERSSNSNNKLYSSSSNSSTTSNSSSRTFSNKYSRNDNDSVYIGNKRAVAKETVLVENIESDAEENKEEDDDDDDKELTEDDIEFLLANTGFTIDQIKKWHVEFMNKCENGLISFEQFKAYYKLLLPPNLNEKSKEEIVTKLFNLFDIDCDENLNFTEFLVSFWIRCKAPIREKFTWIFNMFDQDRNGYLNYYEIRNALNLCLNVDELDLLLEELKMDRNIQKEAENKIKERLFKRIFLDSDSDDENQSSDLESLETDSDQESFNSSRTKSSNYILNKKLNKRKYSTSKSVKQIDEKLHQAIILLDKLSQNQTKNSSLSAISIECLTKHSISLESLNSSVASSNKKEEKLKNSIKRVQITREKFLNLCDKYKLLRKLILPIKYFYEGNMHTNKA